MFDVTTMITDLVGLKEGLANVRKKYLDAGVVDPDVFDALLGADPTGNKKYTDWMFKHVYNTHAVDGMLTSSTNQNLFNIADELAQALGAFDAGLKKGLVNRKDIYQYKSIDDLLATVQELSGKKTKTEERNDAKYEETEKVYEDDDYLIISPQSWEASKRWGKGARWCISYQDSDNYWVQYVHDNRLKFYFIINKRLDSFKNTLGKVALGIDESDSIAEAYDADDQSIDENNYLNILRNDGVPTDIFVHDGWDDMVQQDFDNIIDSISEELDEQLQGVEFEHTYVSFDADSSLEGHPQYAFYMSFGITVTVPENIKVIGDLEDRSDETDENIRDVIEQHVSNYSLDSYESSVEGNSINYYFEVNIEGSATDTMDNMLEDSASLEKEYGAIVSTMLRGLGRDGIIKDAKYIKYNEIFDEIEHADEQDVRVRGMKHITFDIYEDGDITVDFGNTETFAGEKFANQLNRYKQDNPNRLFKRGILTALMESSGPKKFDYAPDQMLMKDIMPKPSDKYKVDQKGKDTVQDAFADARFGKRVNKSLTNAGSIEYRFEFQFKPGSDISAVMDYLEVVDSNYDRFRENIIDELNESFSDEVFYRIEAHYSENFNNTLAKLLSERKIVID